MMDLSTEIKNRRRELHRKQTENDLIQKQVDAKRTKMRQAADELVIGQEALQFVEDIANTRRGAVRGKIESVISEALRAIYGKNHRAELVYDVKNNRSCMDVVHVKSTPIGDAKRTMEGFGGGVSDTISIPLRLLVLIGSKKTAKICMLDEAYKHIGTNQVDVVGDFISEISRRLDVQIIFCSHHELMIGKADTVFRIEERDCFSHVTKEN